MNEIAAAFDDLTSNHYGELVRYLDPKSPARYALDRFLNAWCAHDHENTVPETSADPLRFVPLEDFAAVNEPSADPLIGDRDTNLLPAGALGVAYGMGGAGKTTWLLDLAFHLATGTGWLGLTIPRRIRVGWIENEGPRGAFREKLDRKITAWAGAPLDNHLHVLEEPWAQFTFQNEQLRATIAQAVQDLALELLIVGPVQRLGIEGGGTPAEVNDFVQLLEDTRRLIDRPLAILLVHHENKAGTVSGAWEGATDTTIHVQGQGHGRTRIYWQKARWASALHGTSWHLVWQPGEAFLLEDKPEVTDDTMAEQLLDAVRANPGGSWNQLRSEITGNAQEAARVRDRLIADNAIVNTAPEGRFKLWLPEDPLAARSEPRTALERRIDAETATPDGTTDTVTVPRSRLRERRNGNGSVEPGSHIDEDEVERLADLARSEGL